MYYFCTLNLKTILTRKSIFKADIAVLLCNVIFIIHCIIWLCIHILLNNFAYFIFIKNIWNAFMVKIKRLEFLITRKGQFCRTMNIAYKSNFCFDTHFQNFRRKYFEIISWMFASDFCKSSFRLFIQKPKRNCEFSWIEQRFCHFFIRVCTLCYAPKGLYKLWKYIGEHYLVASFFFFIIIHVLGTFFVWHKILCICWGRLFYKWSMIFFPRRILVLN